MYLAASTLGFYFLSRPGGSCHAFERSAVVKGYSAQGVGGEV